MLRSLLYLNFEGKRQKEDKKKYKIEIVAKSKTDQEQEETKKKQEEANKKTRGNEEKTRRDKWKTRWDKMRQYMECASRYRGKRNKRRK